MDDVDAPVEGDQKDAPVEASAEHGPWDLEDQPELGARVDVGGLRVPAKPGMQMRMELDPKTRRIIAVNVVHDGSALQLQAFAASRSEGVWEGLKQEIVDQIGKQGGAVEEREGAFGAELLARLPVRTKDGRTGLRPVRFVGVDGPRWFLRAVISGKAAIESAAGDQLEKVLQDVVVVRGDGPKPPREQLALHLPGKPGEERGPVKPAIDLEQGRGPEITEVG